MNYFDVKILKLVSMVARETWCTATGKTPGEAHELECEKMENLVAELFKELRYKELLEEEAFLFALQSAGVDNWEGFEVAKELIEV